MSQYEGVPGSGGLGRSAAKGNRRGDDFAALGLPKPPSKASQVKNKTPAPVQVTAEQLLREAHEHRPQEVKAPTQQITDVDELQNYRARKRKEFEDVLRRSRLNMGCWIKYATWEASQKEFDRARSIYERALDVDYRNQGIWIRYIEMEMKNRFVNYARNLWDRAVTLMPRVDQFWFKYAHMEEQLNEVGNARQVYERWMKWEPKPNAWELYIKLELRHKNIDRARNIFERFLVAHPEVATFLKFAKFEEKYGNPSYARKVYERSINELGEEAEDPELFMTFANFETRCKEYARARAIFKYALDHIPKSKVDTLFKAYTSFEKQYGDREGVEQVILSKRRFEYEEELKANSYNYDVWFDYIRLEESAGDLKKTREIYERAIAFIPPVQEKRYWRRYIFLWINFALFEELEAQDLTRAAAVYDKCLDLIPHRKFTFSNIWLYRAQLELRRNDLDGARKILGRAIGTCPKEAIFKGYIEFELQLGDADRLRKLYEKYLEYMPDNCYAWTKYAELESSLKEYERARAIFEIAVNQNTLDMPEVLWKAYIDMEISLKEYDNVRKLYVRLLERTKHPKVWISRAQFEASVVCQIDQARPIFEEADQYFKSNQLKEERVMLLEAWRDFELKYGDKSTLESIVKKLPRRVKKRRPLLGTDGKTEIGQEEYFDYIFPDEEDKSGALKILEMARKWKRQKLATSSSSTSSESSSSDAVMDTDSLSSSSSLSSSMPSSSSSLSSNSLVTTSVSDKTSGEIQIDV
eukprot:TRINITY_DN788_c0_g1_i1.p1 TRINITY_DN788_c0_g1~~TRINITY_DN788_c0_g1_i1.p1  ORF type:complete len:754 (+),score=180.99 TRINITY_DN788_c0_g1_i1:63-2324(+)